MKFGIVPFNNDFVSRFWKLNFMISFISEGLFERYFLYEKFRPFIWIEFDALCTEIFSVLIFSLLTLRFSLFKIAWQDNPVTVLLVSLLYSCLIFTSPPFFKTARTRKVGLSTFNSILDWLVVFSINSSMIPS